MEQRSPEPFHHLREKARQDQSELDDPSDPLLGALMLELQYLFGVRRAIYTNDDVQLPIVAVPVCSQGLRMNMPIGV